jgi:hypothetical protein
MNRLPGRSLCQKDALVPTVVDRGTIKVDGTIILCRVQQVVLLGRDEHDAREFNYRLKIKDFSMNRLGCP